MVIENFSWLELWTCSQDAQNHASRWQLESPITFGRSKKSRFWPLSFACDLLLGLQHGHSERSFPACPYRGSHSCRTTSLRFPRREILSESKNPEANHVSSRSRLSFGPGGLLWLHCCPHERQSKFKLRHYQKLGSSFSVRLHHQIIQCPSTFYLQH